MNREEMLKKIREEVAEERRNYKGPHCCLTLECGLSSDARVLSYNPKYREYGIKIQKSSRNIKMSYCICCGKKLPSSLRIKWADTLMIEHKISDPMYRDKKKIPKEFITDEWWKNRGL